MLIAVASIFHFGERVRSLVAEHRVAVPAFGKEAREHDSRNADTARDNAN